MTDIEQRSYLTEHGWRADGDKRNPFLWRGPQNNGLFTTSQAVRCERERQAEAQAQERPAA